MLTGLEKLTLEQEITLVVIPEAVNLNSNEEFRDIQQQMLSHCGDRMKTVSHCLIFIRRQMKIQT